MSTKVTLARECGSVKGTLDIVQGDFFHIHCLCCDCQNFAEYLTTKEKVLSEQGASELLQTYPEYMEISQGHDNIGCLQLHRKGIYRWHTTCCNMPLANTMNSSKIPFIGVSVKLIQFSDEEEKRKVLGPVMMKAFGKYAIGGMPEDAYTKFPVSYLFKLLSFMLRGFVKGKNKPSPFFSEQQPIVKAALLSSKSNCSKKV